MKNISINYGASSELPDARGITETLSLTVDIDNIEDFETALEDLKERVHAQLNSLERYDKAQRKINKIENRLEKLTEIYNQAIEQYETMTSFMKAQGIKGEFDDFPPLNPRVIKALPENDF